jgi:hypothetical protein
MGVRLFVLHTVTEALLKYVIFKCKTFQKPLKTIVKHLQPKSLKGLMTFIFSNLFKLYCAA